MNKIRLTLHGEKHTIKSIIFSGGEIHANLKDLPEVVTECTMKCWLQSSDDIMHMLMVHDALFRLYPTLKITLIIPYMPYARQDRVCAIGDAFGIEVFGNVLQLMSLVNKIVTLDIHSQAGLSVLQGICGDVGNVEQHDIISKIPFMCDLLSHDDVVLVSPDKGAVGKCLKLVNCFSGLKLVRGDKKRCPQTGGLTGFTVESDYPLAGKRAVIVDDICDGGWTFTGIAGALRDAGCSHVSLYVTHGIFSKGLSVFDNIIDEVYTTDSFRHDLKLESTPNTVFRTFKI